MKEVLNKLKEVLKELSDLLSKDRISDNEKNFIMGELNICFELLKELKED